MNQIDDDDESDSDDNDDNESYDDDQNILNIRIFEFSFHMYS